MKTLVSKQTLTGITVIMPTFNQGSFISRAIKSLYNQQFKTWQLIIINDGSTDYTNDIITDLPVDDRIVYIKNEINLGLGYCLNQGLDNALYNLISYLPSDDIYYQDHLQTLFERLVSSESVLAFSGVLHEYLDHPTNNSGVYAKGQIDNYPLQLVQVLHYKTVDRWIERTELVTDDYGRMYWDKLAQHGTFIQTDQITCEWVDHPTQRHKLINELKGGSLYAYKSFYQIKHSLHFHSSNGNPIDEMSYYQNFLNPVIVENPNKLKILLVGELGYNPERLTSLIEKGHKLYAIWLHKPFSYNAVGPWPFGNIEELDNTNWQQEIKRVKPDIIYALLNYQAVPLAHYVLLGNQSIPFVWHFKEGPFYCRQCGLWRELMELYAISDGQVYCNQQSKDWITQFLPEEEDSLSLILDGDLPSAKWLTDKRSDLLSIKDGEIHTVIPGRPVGISPLDVAILAEHKIHLHFYGNVQQGFWKDWIVQAMRLAPKFLHMHPNCSQENWVSEFSQYDAGWLHYFTSDNQGELMRMKWNDMNQPARIPTYALAGLPMIQKDNSGNIVATQELTKQLEMGLFIKDVGQLAEQIQNRVNMNRLRENVWQQRSEFCFDAHVDSLLEFFHKVIDKKLNR